MKEQQADKDHKNHVTYDDFDIEDSHETSCGVGSFRPKWLSKFGNITTFIAVYSGFGLVTQILSSYVGSQIPTLEKQFGLSSYQTGVLMSCNDIGFLICILAISSWARHVNIPRAFFFCVLLFGSSGILCSLPHFISSAKGTLPVLSPKMVDDLSTPISKPKPSNIPICVQMSENGSSLMSDCLKSQRSSQDVGVADFSVQMIALVLIGGGMFLQGVAKAPRGPFITVYVDDSVDRSKTGFYMGVIASISIFGPALAYVIGAFFSRMYVTLEDVDMSPRDPRWIGAWWLGFIVFGVAAFLIATPVVCFPRRLKYSGKESERRRKRPQSEQHLTRSVIKERLLSYWRILKLPMYVILVASNLCQSISLAGFFSFLPKYIQTQYGVPVWKANFILAGTNIASLSVGTFIGGLITRKVKMTPRRCYKLMIAFYIIHIVLFSSGYFIGCDQPEVVGPKRVGNRISPLTMNCSGSCDCSEKEFFPICGSDGVTYYSPCYAGCESILRRGRIFDNCTCIPDGKASSGYCEYGCGSNLYIWIAVSFLAAFFNAINFMVSYIAKLRCVEDRDKSTGSGLQSFLMSLLAWMPVPIVFGRIVDTTCLIWKTSCSSKGACQHYDIVDYRFKFHAFGFCFKTLALLLCCLGLWKVRKWTDWPQNKEIHEAVIQEQKEILIEMEQKGNGIKANGKGDLADG